MKTNIFRKINLLLLGRGLGGGLLLLIAAPALAQTPDLTVCANMSFSLISSEDGTGAGEVTYTWYEDGVPIRAGLDPSICITEGRPAGMYAYVRKASTEACPEEVASNTYTVRVVAAPIITTQPAASSSICAGDLLSLGVTATGATAYQWKKNGVNVTDGTGGTTANYTTAALTANATYTVVVSNGNCSVTSNAAAVMVHSLPATPTITASAATVCQNAALTFWVASPLTANATYAWTASAGTANGSSYSFNTSTDGAKTATVYVSQAAGGTACQSGTSAVNTALVQAPPAAPTVSGSGTYCGAATLTATPGTGGTGIRWQHNGSTASSISVTASGTYYAVTTAGSCTSGTASVVVTIKPVPATPTIESSGPLAPSGDGISNYCGAATLTATSGSEGDGNTIAWTLPGWTYGGTYPSGTPIGANTSGTYYAEAYSQGCMSERSAVAIIVHPLPDNPAQPSADARCGAGEVTFNAVVHPSCTIHWYDAPGGTIVSEQRSFTTTISQTTTLYAWAYNPSTGCSSASYLAVTATVNSVPAAPTVSGSGTYCGAATLTAAPGAGGTGIRWQHNGSTASSISVTASGTYYAVTTAGSCTSGTASVVVTVLTNCETYQCYDNSSEMIINDNAYREYRDWNSAASYCQSLGAGWRLPSQEELICLCGATTWGERVMFFWTYEMAASGQYWTMDLYSCMPLSMYAYEEAFTVCVLGEVSGAPAAPAVSGSGTYCGSATITATPGANGTGIRWLDDNSTASPRTVTASGTYYAVTTSAEGESDPVPVPVTIVSPLSSPVGVGNTRCGAGTVTISATPPSGAVIDWYANASGGTSLLSGSNSYTTPPINASTTYYAQARHSASSSCVSSRTPVVATVLTDNCEVISCTSEFIKKAEEEYWGDWNTAVAHCQSLGAGWRLPSRDEAACLCSAYDRGLPNLWTYEMADEPGQYWSVRVYYCSSEPESTDANEELTAVCVFGGVSELPAAPTVSGSGTHCGPATITATPGAGGTGIRWLDDNSTASPRTVTTSGTYQVVTTSAAGESVPVPVVVSVNSLAAPSLSRSASSVCVGTAITFTASGGGTYEWNCSGFTCTGTSATQTTPTTAGTYAVQVRRTSGSCTSDWASSSATIIARAALGQAPNTCGCATDMCAGPDGLCTYNCNTCTGCLSYCLDANFAGAAHDPAASACYCTNYSLGSGSYSAVAYAWQNNAWVYATQPNVPVPWWSANQCNASTAPAPPTMGGRGVYCHEATITATPGAGGTGIRWTDNSSTASPRTVTTSGTYYAVSRSATGAVSSPGSVTVTVRTNCEELPCDMITTEQGDSGDWNSATSYCQSLGAGWRLPSVEEATSCVCGEFDRGIIFWTSEMVDIAPGRYWTVMASSCFLNDLDANEEVHTLCVFDGVSAPAAPAVSGSGTYCGAATITATPGANGTGIRWDDGSTTSPRTVTTSGTYTAVTTSAAGTSSSSSVVVTINPVPAAPTMSGGTNCGIVPLTATPGAGGNGIRWTDNSSTVSPRIAYNSGTYYAVTTSAAGCESDPAPVAAFPNYPPLSSLGPPTVCCSGTYCSAATLTATRGLNGTDIVWIDATILAGGGGTATSRVVTTSGMYYAITVSSVTGCTSPPAFVVVTVEPNCIVHTACSGFTRVSSTSLAENISTTWNAAMAYCGSLGDGWRVPEYEELLCLCLNRGTTDDIPGSFPSSEYWYATSYGYIDMDNGCRDGVGYANQDRYVLCVR